MRTKHIRWMTVALVSFGLVAGSLTAAAKPPRSMSLKKAATAAWKRHRSGDVGPSYYRYKGRTGELRARVPRLTNPTFTPYVEVSRKAANGRRRVTTFSVYNPTAGNPVLLECSSKLIGKAKRRSTSRGRSGSSSRGYHRSRSYSKNASLEDARGHAPGTVGHYEAVRRAGFYPDSIGVRNKSGYPSGSSGNRRYWSNPRAPSGHGSSLRSYGW